MLSFVCNSIFFSGLMVKYTIKDLDYHHLDCTILAKIHKNIPFLLAHGFMSSEVKGKCTITAKR